MVGIVLVVLKTVVFFCISDAFFFFVVGFVLCDWEFVVGTVLIFSQTVALFAISVVFFCGRFIRRSQKTFWKPGQSLDSLGVCARLCAL